MDIPILAPAAILVLWSMIVMFWMVGTRFPAFAKANLDIGSSPAGARYQDIEAQLPPHVNWKSHNYTNLMEQPTLFYATVAILALAGEGTGINVTLAWIYVGLRVVHSLWQILVNTVRVRVGIFLGYGVCLLALVINAVRATVF